MTKRVAPRLACDIVVLVGTPVVTLEARVVDVSRMGAQLRVEHPFNPGNHLHLDADGHYYWGRVMWEEPDRIGLKFVTPLTDGPLFAALAALQRPRSRGLPTLAERPAPVRAGFGRRAS